jgi:hypothetical protein
MTQNLHTITAAKRRSASEDEQRWPGRCATASTQPGSDLHSCVSSIRRCVPLSEVWLRRRCSMRRNLISLGQCAPAAPVFQRWCRSVALLVLTFHPIAPKPTCFDAIDVLGRNGLGGPKFLRRLQSSVWVGRSRSYCTMFVNRWRLFRRKSAQGQNRGAPCDQLPWKGAIGVRPAPPERRQQR